MDIAALLIALIALIVSLISLVLVLVVYRELSGKSIVNRNLERPTAQTASGAYPREQGVATRVAYATEQPTPTPFLSAPDLPPETLAPSLGRPPMPKGGFGTRIVEKHDG
jgi:hypothetical protein